MGIADIRAAFNDVAGPRFTCSQAFLQNIPAQDKEWQLLTFSVTSANGGMPFEVKSELLPGSADPVSAARAVAAKLLTDHPVQQGEPQ